VKIPKSINVYGKVWTVSYKWNLKTDEGVLADGLCDKQKKIMWIDRATKPAERSSIFLHELFHAILHELKVGQTDLNREVEEIIVTGIEEFLMENFTIRLKRG